MVLQVIYIVRHGYRTSWSVDPQTGTYSSAIRTPTGIPSDPALASYGVKQAEQLASFLHSLDPKVDLIYSSPYYRCLQTLQPYTTQLAGKHGDDAVKIYVEHGVGEFYGKAHFEHPAPAPLEILQQHFSHLNISDYGPSIISAARGESIPELHDRVAYCLSQLIKRADSDPTAPTAMLICTHAATIISAGRVLTGRMPEDVGEEDFKAFTCGFSKFTRRKSSQNFESEATINRWLPDQSQNLPLVKWRDGVGVEGGWDCELNSDCSFLKGGEERGWRFSGDETFLTDPNGFNDEQKAADLKLINLTDEANSKSRL